MAIDVEETLSRELHAVAGGLRIPALPELPADETPAARRWLPLLVAAVAVLVVAGAAFVGLSRDGGEPQPAPSPTPTPSPSAVETTVATTAPAVPFVLDRQLYVDGEAVPGTWGTVESGPAAWLAIDTDGGWSYGRGPTANQLEGLADVPPVISPNGRYIGSLLLENGGLLSGFDTGFSGEGLGGAPLDLGDRQQGTQVTVRAVTDDGRVIAQGSETAVMWLPLVDNSLVDLTRTAPGQVVLANTPAGLLVSDGEGGEPYLASISEDGVLTRIASVPAHDQVRLNPAGSWLAYVPLGTEGGEVEAFSTLEVATVDAAEGFSLAAPDGWDFAVRAWVWEDGDHLVARVLGAEGERMSRCSVALRRCVLIEAP